MDEKELQPMNDLDIVKPVEPIPNYETDYTEELDLEDIKEEIKNYDASDYNMEPNNYNIEVNNYNMEPSNYNTEVNNYNMESSNYNTEVNNYNIEPSNYNTEVNNYNMEPNNYNTEVNNYNTENNETPVNFFEGLTNDEVISQQVPNYEPAQNPVINETDVVNKETSKSLTNTINEHPDAKIKLNFDKTETEPEEDIKPSDIKVDIKGNKSLMYVLGIGLFLLLIILLLPLFI